MADQPGTVPVTDRRTAPRGVLPRGAQTWVMAALAFGIVLIILVTGRPEPPSRPMTEAPNQGGMPSADRFRDFQDRLRVLDERSRQEATRDEDAAPPLMYAQAPTPRPDPLEADRKRRQYESLFASNVVLSRRTDGQAPTPDTKPTHFGHQQPPPGGVTTPAPTLDEVADAVMRATTRHARTTDVRTLDDSASAAREVSAGDSSKSVTANRPTPASTAPIGAAGPLHRLLEGTLIDTVLTNRLDGSRAAPVNCLVTNPVYSHSGQHVLIPAGARVLGETKPVQALGETRLAVVFHRLLLPDGRTYALHQFNGLNQIGDAGLRDQVNQHYLSTFGASAAVGLITGLSQFLGSVGLGRGDGDRTMVIVGGVGDATTQATAQVMNRFLNRLPTITIREGHRVKIYLTADLELPAYESPQVAARQP